MIGNALNHIGLSTLMYAPLFMLAFGYWQLGNRQMFFNDVPTISHKNEMYDPGHALIDYTAGYNYTMVYLIFLVVFLFFNLYVSVL